MKTADVDILIIPGWSSSAEDHWQSRWEKNLKTARRVEQTDWFNPQRDAWVANIVAAVKRAERPAMLVGHSLGVAAISHAAPHLDRAKVAGAFLVAPADVDNAQLWPETAGHVFDKTHGGFAPLPMAKLPFPAALVASANDPYCSMERAKAMAEAWGAELVEAGDAGHINVDSGHGPWPEGLLRFGAFLARLGK